MPDPRNKFLYQEGDLKIEYPDGTVVDPRDETPEDPGDEAD